MEVNVDSKTVEQAVSNAIVNSAIGAKIQLAVNQLLSKGYDNPIDDAIKKVISETALKIVRDEYADQIRAAVIERMKEETVNELVGRFFDQVIRDR